MATLKTKAEKADPAEFLATVKDPARRKDAETLVRLFGKATGEKPVMWGPSIIGFGRYHYEYESGRVGDMCLAGFSPRADAFALYALSGAPGEADKLAALGKFKTGKACLYIKRLADVNVSVLEDLIRSSAARVREKQQCDICVSGRTKRKAKK